MSGQEYFVAFIILVVLLLAGFGIGRFTTWGDSVTKKFQHYEVRPRDLQELAYQ